MSFFVPEVVDEIVRHRGNLRIGFEEVDEALQGAPSGVFHLSFVVVGGEELDVGE